MDGWRGKRGNEGSRDGCMVGSEREGCIPFFLLKGLKDIKSFWESDYGMQKEKGCIVKPAYAPLVCFSPTCQT